jgi:hypothetical protein
MAVKKRYCEHCDGVNSGGFYDDICIIQQLSEYQQYLFDDGGCYYGCQVPAKVWREAEDCFGDWDSGLTICGALNEERQKFKQQYEDILEDILE